MPPEICPNCGASVPRRAKACPGCGADEHSGWEDGPNQGAPADLGLPEENFNYDEFIQREFEPASPKPPGLHWVWWLTGIGLLLAILFTWIL